ncbi:MAG TPA: ABC transporter permease [Holophagaceae bacterium]|nr:ABC transporter permease [Holophagaceae bacterium]
MSLQELLRIALRAIRAHKMRSFLTLLGIIIGVSTIVGVVGVISGLNRYVAEKVIVMGPDVYILTKFGIIRSREEFIQAVKRPPIRYQEFERLQLADLPTVAQLGAGSGTNMAVNNGTKRLPDVSVVGATANFAELFNLEFEGGRFYSEAEDRAAAHVAVIGADTREELFPYQDPLGRTVLVGGLPFRVIGVMPKQGRSIGFNQDGRIYIPSQVYRKNFMPPNQSLDVYVKARGGVEGLSASQDEVRAFFRAMRHTAYSAPDPFGVLNQEALQQLWQAISGAAFILLVLISSVSLGVGGIVIMNIMLVSVAERTPEIGIRLALGARKKDIRRQFLLEAALLSLFGGLLGVVLGALGVMAVHAATGFPAQVTLPIVGTSVILSTCVGLAAGFLPALRASRLVVIDAIRAE